MSELATWIALGSAVALALAAVVVALVPPLRTRDAARPTRAARRILNTTGVIALLLVVLGLPVPVFAAALVLNATLGRSESVPFSSFAMFSQPRNEAFVIRFVDGSGDPIAVRRAFGVTPTVALKQFQSIRRELRANGAGETEADIAAAETLVARFARRNRGDLPPFRLEKVELRLGPDGVTESVHPLVDGLV
ncbi:MAG: hypothetical protein AAF548_00820 [Actinomycetota bacterium]